MALTANQRTALARFVQSLVELAASFGIELPATTADATRYPAVDSSTPPAVREDRQRLILKDIDAAGGTVTREEWLTIAERYGYDSRRLGGFFAKNHGVGMVEMSPDRKMVQLTPHARSRL